VVKAMTDRRLSGKVALVTGGAPGIGRAIAARLVAEGAEVLVADIDGEVAEATALELGAAALGTALDITSEDQAVAAADQIVGALGGDRETADVDLARQQHLLRAGDRRLDLGVLGAIAVAVAHRQVERRDQAGVDPRHREDRLDVVDRVPVLDQQDAEDLAVGRIGVGLHRQAEAGGCVERAEAALAGRRIAHRADATPSMNSWRNWSASIIPKRNSPCI
jgi:hypothetical protein